MRSVSFLGKSVWGRAGSAWVSCTRAWRAYYGQAAKMLEFSPEWYRDNMLLVFQITARIR